MTEASQAADVRSALRAGLAAWRAPLVDLCAELVRCDSSNPPGDTRAAADVIARFLAHHRAIELRRIAPDPMRVNVVAILRGGRSGPRLVFNGHLDTGPVPEPEAWSVPPFGGVMRDGRIYGRGVTDMKAGVAAQVMALAALAPFVDRLAGELVLTGVADEGSGAALGARHLLETLPETRGDALLSADVGSPGLATIGEKGFAWLELVARGRSAGGAHAHRGVNAADRLIDGLLSLRPLARACQLPGELASLASGAAEQAPEDLARRSVTINLGRIESGIACNQVPSEARALVDLRLPPGLRLAELLAEVEERLCGHEITLRVIDCAEPNWTSPDALIARLVQKAGADVQGIAPQAQWRLGFSDARFWRQRGVPAVGYGVTAHNGSAPDEYVLIDDMVSVFEVHALCACDFLGGAEERNER
ncbi:MAG TPA: M20/M25/M40 family metallo-hydrolase [Geminicoccaceae bacterium]|nr:M20/M25/M40 family metallo-hydrolase [Geminicoccaceae bacterium]